MNPDDKQLESDIKLVRTVVAPFYWLTIGLALLMILPGVSALPDIGIHYWHVFGVIILGIVARLAGSRWVSWRYNRRLAQQYPEILSLEQGPENNLGGG